jgi:uncharacterized membrane protein
MVVHRGTSSVVGAGATAAAFLASSSAFAISAAAAVLSHNEMKSFLCD